MTKLALPLLLGLAVLTASRASERATYNSAGALTGFIWDGATLPLKGEFVVDFGHGVSATLQPHDQRSPISRDLPALRWRGISTFPNGTQAQFEASWTEMQDRLSLVGSVTAGGPTGGAGRALQVESVDYVLDVPRAEFVGGRVQPGDISLSAARPASPVFFRQTTDSLRFVDAKGNWKLELKLDHPREITVTDFWAGKERAYRVRIRLGGGVWTQGDTLPLGLTLAVTGRASAAPARIAVDPAQARYEFDGFGGNFCFANGTPATDYLLENLQHAWARFEFKGELWDRERAAPGPQLRRDFELMQRVQQKGLPWILSLWRLPEHYYSDPYQKPAGTFHRQIAADRWPEFLDLLGSFLLHLKNHYNAEPDLFSFNEPDLGVDIGFSGPEHRDMVKRIGAHLQSLGLKTQLLLGDAANPRDSHLYVLPTAADPEATAYVGAISFHSWGNGTPAQYRAWGDVADWLQKPLLVGEAGVDPGAWRNRAFDSYAYGLREAQQYQELLRDTRPQSLLFWEYTEDYGLVRVREDRSIEPTGRFYLIKHFANLTPLHSRAVESSSDQSDVLVSAFAKDASLVVHVLNTGPARDALLQGLPAGRWRQVVTTENSGWKESTWEHTPARALPLAARSFTTLVRE